MSQVTKIAEKYFYHSNKSNFNEIKKLLHESIVYSSKNTGKFYGPEAVLTMQRDFHSQFSRLQWEVDSCFVHDEGSATFAYTFEGLKKDSTHVKSSGLEMIAVKDDKIVAIEIRNKP